MERGPVNSLDNKQNRRLTALLDSGQSYLNLKIPELKVYPFNRIVNFPFCSVFRTKYHIHIVIGNGKGIGIGM